MSVPPIMALLGGENRRLEVFVKKMGQEKRKKHAVVGQARGCSPRLFTMGWPGKLFSVTEEKKGDRGWLWPEVSGHRVTVGWRTG